MEELKLPACQELQKVIDQKKSDSEVLKALVAHVQAEHALGRRPLFVLGAGISAGEVPFLFEMALHLGDKLSSRIQSFPDKSIKKLLENLKELGERIGKGEALRSDAAEFFFTLQGSAPRLIKEIVTKIWREFSFDLMSGRIKKRQQSDAPANDQQGGRYPPIQDANPTRCHRWIASQLLEEKAWCLSLNFDRLTSEAVVEESNHEKGCAALYTVDQVDGYFRSSTLGNPLPVVFKVRGDVFYATCTHTGCPLAQAPIPLHALLRQQKEIEPRGGEGTLFSTNSQPCFECNVGDLVLQLSFPGFRAKEEEALPLLERVASYIHHRISAIVVIGLSGRWDDYMLQYLFRIAFHWGVPMIDVKPETKPVNPIEDFARSYRPRIMYRHLSMEANGFADKWKQIEKAPTTRVGIAKYEDAQDRGQETLHRHVFDPDRVWLKEEGQALEVKYANRDGQIRPLSFRLDDLRTALADLLPQIVKERLSSIAQLAIDNLVLTGHPGAHNRWYHSLGAATVGLVWYERLMQEFASHTDDSKKERIALAVALILHDYGHLPFSHLIEQVLDQINWISPAYRLYGSEFNVLARRLSVQGRGDQRDQQETTAVRKLLRDLERRSGLASGSGREFLLRLITGVYGKPWLSSIVNSPIDADKIDYIFRDIWELTRGDEGGLSFQTRLPSNFPSDWLSEFLGEQRINEHGILCLDGRSAMAMLQLLEERMFLYKYFYRSPEVRLAERIASEFVQQYAIRKVWEKIGGAPGYLKQFEGDNDLRRAKNLQVQVVLEEEYEKIGLESEREWKFLGAIRDEVVKFPTDKQYQEFLNKIYKHLEWMIQNKGVANLRSLLQRGMLVESPCYFHAKHFQDLRKIIRPLQHQYCCDVLFDLVALPSFLSTPRSLGIPLWDNARSITAVSILVPKGPAERWTFRSVAHEPLGPEAFKSLHQDLCMVYIFDPYEGNRPQAYYARDKFLIACKRAGIPISEDERKVTP